jgi:chromosome segregation ATPase
MSFDEDTAESLARLLYLGMFLGPNVARSFGRAPSVVVGRVQNGSVTIIGPPLPPMADSDDSDADFEREELSRSSSEDAQQQPPAVKRCDIAFGMLERMREVDTELGERLMTLLEAAEGQSEGYYLATANRLKAIHEGRMENLRLHTELVALHQRAHAYCDADSSAKRRLEARNDELLMMTRNLERDLGVAKDEVRRLGFRLVDLEKQTDSLTSTADGYKNQIECLNVQLKSREESYRAKLRGLEASLSEEKRKQTTHRRLISYLNKKIRGVVKSVREGYAAGRPNCHILGTYDDVLGGPV